MEYKIFGCKTNKYFTEKWMNDPRVMGKSGIFVSSCIVTQKADKKWKKFILQYLKKNPEEIVFLSGCAPIRKGELRSDFYDAYPELQEYKNRIELLEEDPEENTWTTQMEENTSSHQAKDDFIDGNRIATEIHKESSTNTGKHITKIKTFSQIPELNTQKLSVFKEKFSKIYTRKYLVIQTGCDNYCTFCLTVQARGGHKNRSTESILQEIQEFVEKGGKEVVLTGTNIGAFGASNSNKVEESRFCELIETILEKTSIHRIRISSLWVEFLSDTLFNLLTNKRLHAYVHLSIQSGSDRILKAMNRHYDRPFLINRLEKLSNLTREDWVRINIGADLIVGFPGENEADFADTLDIVKRFQISNLHAFPFSPHEGMDQVPAAHFPEAIPDNIKTRRWNDLMQAGKEAKRIFLESQDGKILELLPEAVKNSSNYLLEWRGYSENHIALNALNFTPINTTKIERWVPVSGVYHFSQECLEIPEASEQDGE